MTVIGFLRSRRVRVWVKAIVKLFSGIAVVLGSAAKTYDWWVEHHPRVPADVKPTNLGLGALAKEPNPIVRQTMIFGLRRDAESVEAQEALVAGLANFLRQNHPRQPRGCRGVSPLPTDVLEAVSTIVSLSKGSDRPRWSWLRLRRTRAPNFAGTQLESVDIGGAVFESAILRGVNFKKACLGEANFDDAILDKAVFDEAILRGAKFVRASLRGASLQRADLTRANFQKTDLGYAAFDSSSLYGASFTGGDLACALLGDAMADSIDVRQAALDWSFLGGASLRRVQNWDRVNTVAFAFLAGARDLSADGRRVAAQQGAYLTDIGQLAWGVRRDAQLLSDSLCAVRRPLRDPLRKRRSLNSGH